MEFLYQFGDEREWVFVLYCDGIQSTVVLYQLKGSVFLFEEDWRGHRGFGQLDAAGFQIFLQEGIKFLLFGRGEWVDLTSRWGPSWDEFYGMIPRLGVWQDIKGFFGEHSTEFSEVGQDVFC